MYAQFLMLSLLATNDGVSKMMLNGNKKEELHIIRKYSKRDIFLPLYSYNIKRAYNMDCGDDIATRGVDSEAIVFYDGSDVFISLREKKAPFAARNETAKRFRIGTIKKANNLKVKFMAFRLISV